VFLRLQQQPSHPPLSPLRQPPEPIFADPLPTSIHLIHPTLFPHLLRSFAQPIFADPLPTLHLHSIIISGPFFADPLLSGGRRGRGRRRTISSTEFPPVAATGAEEGEGVDSSTDFPPVAATGAQRSPTKREPSAYGSREPDRATNPRARVTGVGVYPTILHYPIILSSYHRILSP